MQKTLVNAGMNILTQRIGKEQQGDSNNERSKSFQYDRLDLKTISGHGRRNQRPSSMEIPKENNPFLSLESKVRSEGEAN